MEQLDSKDELYFSWWCNDLIEAHILHQYNKSSTIKLFDGLYHEYKEIKELKTKTKEVDKKQCLIDVTSYTPDYDLYFDINKCSKLADVLCDNNIKFCAPLIGHVDEDTGNIKVIIEIKPIFDQNNMTRLFKLNQKWTYQLTGQFVNLIEYSKLFKETFTPSRFLLTDSGRQERKIDKWKVKTLNEFLNL